MIALDFFADMANSIAAALTPPFRWRDIADQLVFVAWESLPVILFCVCFAAGVTVIESSFHMKLVVHNDALVPGFTAMLILRELGAVISALLLTSRVGAGIAAEIASMQITEQVDALKMLGLNPVRFLVAPRLIACVIGGLLLCLIANIVCLASAMWITQVRLGYSPVAFLDAMKSFVGLRDLFFAGIKGAVFGAIIPLVGCFCGFHSKRGAEGVGQATTNSVVISSVAIIVADFVLSFVFSFYY